VVFIGGFASNGSVVLCATERAMTTSPPISSLRDLGGFGRRSQGSISSFLAGHGGNEERGFSAFDYWWSDLQQGSMITSLGSFIMAPNLSWTSTFEWRPLRPLASAMSASGRRLQVFFNLQEDMPLCRPFGYNVVSSHLPIPSGVIPDDIEGGYVELQNHGGQRAGPDCIFNCVLWFFVQSVMAWL
jgi:hypothetical protein